MTGNRNIIFAIDVEPDARIRVQGDNWDGLRIAMRELQGLRMQLEQATQARVQLNWFLRFDPQVEETWGWKDWLRKASPEFLSWLRESGDFTGIHLHFWKWDNRRGLWFSEFRDTEWQRHCLEVSVAGYREVFGRRPIASRFGDRAIGTALLPHLRKAGIRYDLTIEPGAAPEPSFDDPYATGWLPDFRRAPRIPYLASEEDFLAPDPAGAVWMIPVGTSASRWIPRRRYPFLVKTSDTLNLVLEPRRVWRQLSAEMDRTCAEPLVILLRSGDLAQPHFLANFRYVTERMARHAGIGRCRFLAVDAAMERYAGMKDGLCLSAS